MDIEHIKSLIKKDVAWTDSNGNSLLHHAASTGDADLVKLCLQSGVNSLACNKNNECARDIARAWGYDKIAAMIDTDMKQVRAASPAAVIAYTSLQEIRDQSIATGSNIFYTLASQGLFDQVAALAGKDPAGLMARDLLGQGPDGETVLLKVCQQGQLAELMKAELWTRNSAEFLTVWEKVPKIYQTGLDVGGFMNRIRQNRLKSVTQRPPGKGLP